MTSEVKFDLGFEISDLKNPYSHGIIVHLLVNLGTCKNKNKNQKYVCSWAANKQKGHKIVEELNKQFIVNHDLVN